jgi:hypothetical protein
MAHATLERLREDPHCLGRFSDLEAKLHSADWLIELL